MKKIKIKNLKVENSEELIKQMKEALRDCPAVMRYCKEIGMSEQIMDENITKIYDLVRDTNYCRKCPGLQKCEKENAYLITKITYANNVVESQLIPCKELLRRISFEKQLIIRDFPDEWLDISVFDVDKSKTKTEALTVYSNYLKNISTNWLYIEGGIGSGKSYLAAAIAIDLAKRAIKGKAPICFINASTRFLELNDLSKQSPSDFKTKLELYCTVPVLIIDDFGHELKTDFIRDAIVNEIITTRCNKRLFTIFTSNFTLDEIETLYATNASRAIMAKQIVKTIRSMLDREIDLGDLKLY
ncbi:MAG TPA: ATP-binding protein [Erysipelotrichaceae bacterium]|nr:ATP-binding protein [Erysipelotrichaceae bacterium]